MKKDTLAAILDLQQRPSPRSVRWLLGFAFLAAWGVSLTTFLDAVRFIGRPFAGFGFTDARFVTPVLFAPATPDAPDVRLWDEIVAFNGDGVTNADDLAARIDAVPPDTDVRLTLRRESVSIHDVTIRLKAFTVTDFFRWHTNQSILAMVIIAIGALVWLLRSGSKALAFSIVCVATGLMCAGGVDGTLFRRFPHLFHLSAPFVPAASLAFAVRLSPRLARQRWNALVWGVPFLLGTVLAMALMAFNDGPVHVYAALGITAYACLVLGATMFFVVMLDAWRRPEGTLEGARAGVIVGAFPLGLGLPALNFLLAFTVDRFELTAVPNVAVLLMPASVAYAIFRQDLFEADLALRRLMADVLLTVGATAMYALALSGVYVFFNQGSASPAVAVALAALLLALAFPIRDRLKARIDRVLEGRRYDDREAIASLSRALSTELSLDRVLERIAETLRLTVRPTEAGILLLNPDGAPQLHPLTPVPVPTVSADVFRGANLVVARSPDSSDVEEEEKGGGRVRAALLPDGVQAVIPLRASGREMGALILGRASGRLHRYTAADLVFMRTVAGQAAPTLANARVFDEVDRLNRTLEERVRERTAELLSVNEELRALDKRKDELISTVSHDFRSPLSIIRSHVDTMLSDPHMDPATRQSFLQVIERQVRRLSSMVENLLDLARMRDRGLNSRAIHVGDLLRAAADGVRPKMDSAGVTFRTDVPQGVLTVKGDPERLSQVFQNLLDNASKFTPRGGEVRLYARHDGGHVIFGVTDTGIGIPEADQSRVCEPFYQVKRAGAEREGSGLGLAIVKEIVERHESRLELKSSSNGTTWEFELPVPAVDTEPQESAA